ncbi:MerR family transcriptional regulator, partial [Lentibacter algarum]
MAKSAEAFRTISEVAEWLDLPTHVLRFWESKFTQVKPVKRAGGRRYYRPNDMVLLGGIKKLLHDDGMTIKGAQKMLRDHGVKHISSLSQPLDGELAEVVSDTNAIDMVVDAPSAPKPEADIVPFTHRKSTDESEATET